MRKAEILLQKKDVRKRLKSHTFIYFMQLLSVSSFSDRLALERFRRDAQQTSNNVPCG
jgi:hypothetical protein